MKRVHLDELVIAGAILALALPAGAGKPQPQPSPAYRASEIHGGCADRPVVDLRDIGGQGLAGGSGCQYPELNRATFWDLATKPTVADPMWIDPDRCDTCESLIQTVGADGQWAAGWVCDTPGQSCGSTDNPQIPTLWERDSVDPSTFVRVTLGDPTPPRPTFYFVDSAVVGEQRVVLEWRGLFREGSLGWQWEAGPSGMAQAINDAGTVCGDLVAGASVWECAESTCGSPVPLPVLDTTVHSARGIDSAGNIAGFKGPGTGSCGQGLVWRRQATAPTYVAPELLPLSGYSSCCVTDIRRAASGELTVIGQCENRKTGSPWAVRWRSSSPGVWSGPERLDGLDDHSIRLNYALRFGADGQILINTGDTASQKVVLSPLP